MPILLTLLFLTAHFASKLLVAHCFWVPILLKILLADLVKAYP